MIVNNAAMNTGVHVPFRIAVSPNIYPGKTIDICTSVFRVALFILAKAWKQPKYPSTDEWIKEM